MDGYVAKRIWVEELLREIAGLEQGSGEPVPAGRRKN